jgi:hypothetical protein
MRFSLRPAGGENGSRRAGPSARTSHSPLPQRMRGEGTSSTVATLTLITMLLKEDESAKFSLRVSHLSASSGRKVTPASFIAAICCNQNSCCFFKFRRLVIFSHSSAA